MIRSGVLARVVLLRGGNPPVAIGLAERAEYLGALEDRQLGRGDAGWQSFMWERLDASLSAYLDHLAQGLDPGGDRA